jgi:2-haloacid dehalogenase
MRENTARLPLDRIRALSFDCYGTLIDWQTGILQAVRSVLARHGVVLPDEEIVRRFAEAERTAEAGKYVDYKEVQRRVMRGLLGPSAGVAGGDEVDGLWRSIGDWPVFADTLGALQRLQSKFRVCIASNIDDDLSALTRPKLGIEPDVVVTAQQVRSYKPGEAHFRELLRRLGLPAAQVLHVAESVFHDIEPATRMGFPTVLVDRQGGGASASGAGTGHARLGFTVRSLAELADRLLRAE